MDRIRKLQNTAEIHGVVLPFGIFPPFLRPPARLPPILATKPVTVLASPSLVAPTGGCFTRALPQTSLAAAFLADGCCPLPRCLCAAGPLPLSRQLVSCGLYGPGALGCIRSVVSVQWCSGSERGTTAHSPAEQQVGRSLPAWCSQTLGRVAAVLRQGGYQDAAGSALGRTSVAARRGCSACGACRRRFAAAARAICGRRIGRLALQLLCLLGNIFTRTFTLSHRHHRPISSNGQVQEPHGSQPEQEEPQERHQEAHQVQVHLHQGREFHIRGGGSLVQGARRAYGCGVLTDVRSCRSAVDAAVFADALSTPTPRPSTTDGPQVPAQPGVYIKAFPGHLKMGMCAFFLPGSSRGRRDRHCGSSGERNRLQQPLTSCARMCSTHPPPPPTPPLDHSQRYAKKHQADKKE
jgi:hypothetical protein